MITISILNIKGGVGKTTTSLNVAAGLADRGKRVLLIDYDPQSNTTSIFKVSPEVTIGDIMLETIDIKDALNAVEENLWVIPSNIELANIEVSLRMQSTGSQHDKLHKALKQVEFQFDYCIIDCAPNINILTLNAIYASNVLIIPIKPDKFALQGFNVTIESINNINENYELNLDYFVIFTVVNRNSEEKRIIQAVRSLVGQNAFKAKVRNQPSPVVKASNANKMVIRNLFTSVSKDYRNVVGEILRRFPNDFQN